MSATHYYSDDKSAQMVIALLKAHGIKKVIANPGTTNIAIVGSVQNDPWFEVYSGIDERHSAYMAVGMAAETGRPVVLSCTGATASRNYLPALTEAYYRKLPVLAITSMQNFDNVGQLSPQAIDRTAFPKDAVIKSFQLRAAATDRELKVFARRINEAILELKRNGGGPVHINLEMGRSLTFKTEKLCAPRKIERIEVAGLSSAPKIGKGTKVAVFFGSGRIDEKAWTAFANSHDAVAFVDGGSSYCGPNAIHASLLCSQHGFKANPKYAGLKPDLIVDAGEVSGDYPTLGYFANSAPVWRVSPDGEIRDRFGRLEHVFEMPDKTFAGNYLATDPVPRKTYYEAWEAAVLGIADAARKADLPFSNPFMARELSSRLPENSVVHFGILNSLRAWNIFPVPGGKGIRTYCNVGGFGIDGALSTLVGSSIVSPQTLHFGIVGDLAFFYDMNALGNRHIGKNLRILLVNNGCGTEFNMSFHPGSQFGERTNEYIAAGRHFGNRSRAVVKAYVEALGFRYLSADGANGFMERIDEFVAKDVSCPIVFECFTAPKDESDAYAILHSLDSHDVQAGMMPKIKGLVPNRIKSAAKVLLGTES